MAQAQAQAQTQAIGMTQVKKKLDVRPDTSKFIRTSPMLVDYLDAR